MNSGFFEGFEGSRLSVRQTWLDPARLDIFGSGKKVAIRTRGRTVVKPDFSGLITAECTMR
jgi:hypothetical protein